MDFQVEAAFEQEGAAGPRLRGGKLWAAPWKPCSSSASRRSYCSTVRLPSREV